MENAASTALLLVLNQWCHVPNGSNPFEEESKPTK